MRIANSMTIGHCNDPHSDNTISYQCFRFTRSRSAKGKAAYLHNILLSINSTSQDWEPRLFQKPHVQPQRCKTANAPHEVAALPHPSYLITLTSFRNLRLLSIPSTIQSSLPPSPLHSPPTPYRSLRLSTSVHAPLCRTLCSGTLFPASGITTPTVCSLPG